MGNKARHLTSHVKYLFGYRKPARVVKANKHFYLVFGNTMFNLGPKNNTANAKSVIEHTRRLLMGGQNKLDYAAESCGDFMTMRLSERSFFDILLGPPPSPRQLEAEAKAKRLAEEMKQRDKRRFQQAIGYLNAISKGYSAQQPPTH